MTDIPAEERHPNDRTGRQEPLPEDHDHQATRCHPPPDKGELPRTSVR